MSRRSLVACAVSAALMGGFSANASAAFFQLAENSPAGLGSAFSGGAALAEDASTVWYNPAGMTRLSGSQIVAGIHYIMPSTKFSKTSATRSATLGGTTISGGEGGNAGEDALVPNFFFSNRINDRIVIGVGINAPYGLATDYEDDWVGRYHADRSEIKTVNINPAVAFKVNDEWSLGVGLNYQKLEATLTQAVDFGALLGAPGSADGNASVDADDSVWGYNLGALWQISPDTRIGVAYRSKMKYALSGTFDVTAPNPTAAAAGATQGIIDSGASANVTIPATASVSLNQVISPSWVLMADVTRTEWSKLPELRIDFDSTQRDSVVTLNLKNVFRYSVGVKYLPGGAWSYQAGIALDNTPTPDEAVRTPRLPDTDRKWVTLGAGYKSSESMRFDVSVAHLTGSDVSINKTAGTSSANENFLRGNLVGTYTASVNILSAQLNWTF